MRFVLFKKIKILQQFLTKFLQTKNNNFKSFRFFVKSMRTIIRKVILDNLMQKQIEFILIVEFLRMRIDLFFSWLLKDTALVRKIIHTHTEERSLIWSYI